MAQQKGIFPLCGTIGYITFYKSKDGFLARAKGGVNGKRIATDPAFQRTRENAFEFGRACSAGKVLRRAVGTVLPNTPDSKMPARLIREMVKVIQADKTSKRGQRNVIDGESELLRGFEFNDNCTLGTTLFAPLTAGINRATGELTINLASFIPMNMIAAPGGTTHFKIVSSGAEIDFEEKVFTADVKTSAALPWDSNDTAVINLVNTVPAASTKPLFLVLGIEFYQEVNGSMYSLNSGAFNSLTLVEVSSEW